MQSIKVDILILNNKSKISSNLITSLIKSHYRMRNEKDIRVSTKTITGEDLKNSEKYKKIRRIVWE